MSLDRASQYWRETFGLTAEEYRRDGILVCPHSQTLSGRNAAWVFLHEQSCVISVPAPMVDEVERGAPGLEIRCIHKSESLRRLFGDRIERTVGPSYQGYCEQHDFRPVGSRNVRRMIPADRPFLERFITGCPKEDRDDSGVDPDSGPLFGFFIEEELASLGGAIPWAPYAANPAVITHPNHRGKGYATPVVSAVMNHILEEKKAVLYQTLLSNVPAVRIAERLGCRLYARMTFVALSDSR